MGEAAEGSEERRGVTGKGKEKEKEKSDIFKNATFDCVESTNKHMRPHHVMHIKIFFRVRVPCTNNFWASGNSSLQLGGGGTNFSVGG